MRTLKLTLTYDGTRFVGWQRQGRVEGRVESEGESIQGLLEAALARFEGAPVVVHGAGRTDAGVHALGQVASVSLTCEHDVGALERGLNAQLPADIRVLRVDEVPSDFHARFSATSKTYQYRIRNAPLASPFERQYVWHVPEPLDVPAMRAAAAKLVGTHDFAAFRSAGTEVTDSVRCVTRSELLFEGSSLVYEIDGSGFLRHMVRAVVGTLVEIGRGWRSPDSIEALLEGGSRADAGVTAPARGLFLVRVEYD